MRSSDETSEASERVPELGGAPIRGLIVIWSRGAPAASVLYMPGGRLTLGRGQQEQLFSDDDRASREHCRVEFDAGSWCVTDLGSRNGTFLNGARLEAAETLEGPPLLRVGRTLLRAVDDVRPYNAGVRVESDGVVLGGLLKRAWAEIELAAQAGSTLCLKGESGSGKELAARAFHQAGSGKNPGAPFIAVNCAAIPEGLAERLLFGARRGAYSGASGDVQGYLQAADGGTLFLDEIAELDLRVQAKILRVLETKQVLSLGATRADPVELRVCVAAHADLREEVRKGRFREDLYYRVGRPEVQIAPLRARCDELSFFIQGEITRTDPKLHAHVELIEACALRPWPGNVRELLGEVRRAAHRALRARKTRVGLEDLDLEAGLRLTETPDGEANLEAEKSGLPEDARIERTLLEHGGNVTQAARALGIHRNQLRRWLAKRPTSPPQEVEDER
jgi:transcriptional regulator of acetoin/glycerol metabolism